MKFEVALLGVKHVFATVEVDAPTREAAVDAALALVGKGNVEWNDDCEREIARVSAEVIGDPK